jgi:hypothetical protein
MPDNSKAVVPYKKRPTKKQNAKRQPATAKAVVAKTNRNTNRVARIKQTSNYVSITHREYVQDVTAHDSGFAVDTFGVNPGVSATFPWLAQIASRFESYLFERLHFIYQPICPTSVPGTVMMAIDYDAEDATPSNKVTLMSYKGATRTAPWDTTTFNAARSDLHKFGIQRYIRATPLSTGQDYKTYDVGTLMVATQNTPATESVLGELYVEYSVRLYTPQIGTQLATTNVRNQLEQITLTIPAGTAPFSLNSIIYGDGNSPIAWLDTIQTGAETFARMIVDLNNMGPFLMSLVNTGAIQTKANFLNMARNARAGGNPTDGYPWSALFLGKGGGFPDTIPTTPVSSAGIVFKPQQASKTYNSGPGLLPLYWGRPASGTSTYNIQLTPLTFYQPFNGTSESPIVNNNLLWDYRQISPPQLAGISPTLRESTVVLPLNTLKRVKADDW